MAPLMGLTGGYASGKSLVLSIFQDMGAYVIDCDQIARQVVEKGSEGLARIRETFGEEVMKDDGSLERGRLAELVFTHEERRRELEGILHPLIIQRVFDEAEEVQGREPGRIVVVDTPLLFETGLDQRMDKIVVVVCGQEESIRRGMDRDGLTRDQAMARINAQEPLEEKAKKADWVVDNSGNMETTRQIAADVWGKIKRL
ncbi:MAG: dephospho-CoA kinase [Nitrospinota bacterium]|nr:dephospho-CoA kinase [Nitrospinota bacterium]